MWEGSDNIPLSTFTRGDLMVVKTRYRVATRRDERNGNAGGEE